MHFYNIAGKTGGIIRKFNFNVFVKVVEQTVFFLLHWTALKSLKFVKFVVGEFVCCDDRHNMFKHFILLYFIE